MGGLAERTAVSRAIHTIEGIFKGISADCEVNEKEIHYVKEWLEVNKRYRHIYPFCEAYELIERILDDNRIDQDEKEEFLDFCSTFVTEAGSISKFTQEMRILHGFIEGIVCDNLVKEQELRKLREWMAFHADNQDKWPFNEIFDLSGKIIKDGFITQKEQGEFINYCTNYIGVMAPDQSKDSSLYNTPWMINDAPIVNSIRSIIDQNAKVCIPGKIFCFTGIMERPRTELKKMAEFHGGKVNNAVSKSIDFLVIGDKSSPAWNYTTYGTKIEKALNSKNDITIVSERSFLQAIQYV